jgi:hypothetical protein
MDKGAIVSKPLRQIVISLTVIILVSLSGIYLMIIQLPSNSSCSCPLTASVISTHFNESPDNMGLVNGGGWTMFLTWNMDALGPKWEDMTIMLYKDDHPSFEVRHIDATTSDLEFEPKKGPKWYLKAEMNTTHVRFSDGGIIRTLEGNESLLDIEEVNTIEGAHFIVIDRGGDERISKSDTVVIFRDPNADGIDNIEDGTMVIFKTSAGELGSSSLT